MLNGVHQPTNSVLGAVWTGLFRMIHRANVVIDAKDNVKTFNATDETRKKELLLKQNS